MNRFLAFLFSAPLLLAGVLPDHYIVELSAEPVAAQAARLRQRGESPRVAMSRPAVESRRILIRAEQQLARTLVEAQAGEVLDTVENVANALLVRIPDAQAARLQSVPGVLKVYPVLEQHLLLDHALPLHKVPQAWSQVGYGNAGAGVKIALIDTGVDLTHPGMQDPSLPMPAGFPRASTDADLAYTNQKVIVARSYVKLLARADPDLSPRDHVGHGTATSMCAAGAQNSGPLATITGVAPKAWIGSYKVFGTPGVNKSTSSLLVLKAIDDAVADGMDIISLSVGSDLAVRLADDAEVAALERASELGVVVVVAAGNNGPDPGTIGSPAVAPSAISVGAALNDRFFASRASAGGTEVVAIPGAGANSKDPIVAPLVDVASLDGNGLACGTLPADSLKGAIAFILRGTCFFEDKLNHAQAAGAVGALVYTYAGTEPFSMGVGAATLPGMMISNADGVALKARLIAPLDATLNFALTAAYRNPTGLASFSAEGPNVDLSIKPDMVAVGQDVYLATQRLDPNGDMYDAGGYSLEQGTSFSAPMVAGAAALLKAARPGLSAAQYRSLLINSAAPAWLNSSKPARVQQAGGGSLDVLAALNATAAIQPTALSLGTEGSSTGARVLTISNTGTAADTFTLSAAPTGTGPAPVIDPSTLQLAPGASGTVAVTFADGGLAAGAYEGVINVQASGAGTLAHVPYWYGVGSGTPTYITTLFVDSAARAGFSDTDAILFKLSDAGGLPVRGVVPTVAVASGNATVTALRSRDSIYPNAFGISLRFGVGGGPVVIRITAGELTKDVSIVTQ